MCKIISSPFMSTEDIIAYKLCSVFTVRPDRGRQRSGVIVLTSQFNPYNRARVEGEGIQNYNQKRQYENPFGDGYDQTYYSSDETQYWSKPGKLITAKGVGFNVYTHTHVNEYRAKPGAKGLAYLKVFIPTNTLMCLGKDNNNESTFVASQLVVLREPDIYTDSTLMREHILDVMEDMKERGNVYSPTIRDTKYGPGKSTMPEFYNAA